MPGDAWGARASSEHGEHPRQNAGARVSGEGPERFPLGISWPDLAAGDGLAGWSRAPSTPETTRSMALSL